MAELRIPSQLLRASRAWWLAARPSLPSASLGLQSTAPARLFSVSAARPAGDAKPPLDFAKLFAERLESRKATGASTSSQDALQRSSTASSKPMPPPPPPRQPTKVPSRSSAPPASKGYDATRSTLLDLDAIMGGRGSASSSSGPLALSLGRGGASRPPKPEIRLRPVTGRTVHLRPGIDFGTAANHVNRLVRRSGLPRITYRQQYHERPGLKRKRLRSERWREKFKRGFVATVRRVQELTKQGW